MLQVCGRAIPDEDAETLIALLEEDVTLVSDEAAGAIRFARDSGCAVERLDPDIRTAILHVLAEPPSESLAALRDALASSSGP